MPYPRPTSGDPGKASMAGLQEVIRRNLNARHLIGGKEGQLARDRSGRIVGLIGGPPLPRSVSSQGGLPPEPPYGPYQGPPLALPGDTEVSIPGGSGGEPAPTQPVSPIVPSIDHQTGGGMPVSMALEVGIDDVQGVVSGVLRGPLLVRGWQITTQGMETTSAQWNLWRVDFSEYIGLQAFAFNNNGLPTAGAKDGVSLFWDGAIHDQTTLGGQIPTLGWSRLIGPLASSGPTGFLSCWLIVPYENVFVKFYCQNDSAGARIQNLFLDVARLAGVPTQQEVFPRVTTADGPSFIKRSVGLRGGYWK